MPVACSWPPVRQLLLQVLGLMFFGLRFLLLPATLITWCLQVRITSTVLQVPLPIPILMDKYMPMLAISRFQVMIMLSEPIVRVQQVAQVLLNSFRLLLKCSNQMQMAYSMSKKEVTALAVAGQMPSQNWPMHW